MIKFFLKHRKKAIVYLGKHVEYNAFIHVLGGIGLGIILASPLTYPHPVRWALVLLGLSLAGHFYAITAKK